MSEYALDGLKQVMAVKSRVVLPYLVPVVSLVLLGSPYISDASFQLPCEKKIKTSGNDVKGSDLQGKFLSVKGRGYISGFFTPCC